MSSPCSRRSSTSRIKSTEAHAVDSEGYPRPQDWNCLLLERRAQSCTKLFNLDTINLGFIRLQ